MKRCYGYIRVSTQKQGEGASLEAQQEAILAFASRQGLRIEKWFEEKQTAAKSGRPIFNTMLRDLRRLREVGLVMHKIDRSARNLRDWAAIHELSDAGIDVHFATETLDFRSRGGRLTADIQAVIAADYIRNLREETTKGLRGRLRQGLYPFRAPIGYLDNGRGKPKTPCPLKAPLVKAAYDLYATGQHSIRSVGEELQRLGLRGHRGQPLSQHGVEKILANPFYTGLIVIVRTGDIYEGIHEAIVDPSTYQRVQDIKSGKAGKKVTRHNHLYRGLFRCGLCDGPMSPERQKGHVYYRCQRADCKTKTVREDCLATAITAGLRRVQLSKTDARKLQKEWLAWLEDGDNSELIRSLELQKAQCESRLDRLTDLLVDDQITEGEYNVRKQTCILDLSGTNEKLAKLTTTGVSRRNVLTFLELMENLIELHQIAEPAEKRILVENVFSNRRVTGKDPVLEPYSWLESRDPEQLTPMVTLNDPLIELCRELSPAAPAPKKHEQWRHNLQNLKPAE